MFRAFETLDAGATNLPIAQLEAIQTVIEAYQHAMLWWELERAQIEELLHQVTTCLDQHRTTPSADQQ